MSTSMELIKVPGLAPGGNKCCVTNQVDYVSKGSSESDESVEESILLQVDKYQVRPFLKDIRERVFD